jgi:hypothetical protein
MAQSAEGVAPGIEPAMKGAPAGNADPQPLSMTPLTVRRRYRYALKRMFGESALATAVLRGGLDQFGIPHQWGAGPDTFAMHVASRLALNLIRQNIEFGVSAFDREDPHYIPDGPDGTWRRARYAALRTFTSRRDDGRIIPAYSLIIADLAVPFIAAQWGPPRYRTTGYCLRAGALSLGGGVAINVSREFWPDLKRKLSSHRIPTRLRSR